VTGGTEVIADTIKTAEDHTLYAQWKINQYTITFDSDGGSVVESITQDYGTAITAPSDPTREGYDLQWLGPALGSGNTDGHAGGKHNHHRPVDGCGIRHYLPPRWWD
jgi:hypothetical protein